MGPLWSRAGLSLDFYLGKELCDEIVKPDKDVTEFVDKAVTERLKKERREKRR